MSPALIFIVLQATEESVHSCKHRFFELLEVLLQARHAGNEQIRFDEAPYAPNIVFVAVVNNKRTELLHSPFLIRVHAVDAYHLVRVDASFWFEQGIAMAR